MSSLDNPPKITTDEEQPYDYDKIEELLYTLHKVTCVYVRKSNGHSMWELRYRNMKTYINGTILKQVGGSL
jgi:hypothetical protein